MQLGNYEEAINDFNKSIEIDPLFSEAYFRGAIANYKLKSADVFEIKKSN